MVRSSTNPLADPTGLPVQAVAMAEAVWQRATAVLEP